MTAHKERAPLYLTLSPEERRERAGCLQKFSSPCMLCPRICCADRAAGLRGCCRAPSGAAAESYSPHFGEEKVLVGTRGSGTIFFAHCNLACVFCQNWPLSQMSPAERELSTAALAGIMLELQKRGCHNINLVTPTPYLPWIVYALDMAAEKGLRLPLVYNSSGYESVAVLKLLDGLVDIYMPDAKYSSDLTGERFSGVKGYYSNLQKALREMQRQVGDLAIDENGVAYRGLLVRHLILPDGLAGTAELVRFLKDEISPNCAINIMSQYRPEYRAAGYPPLDRRTTRCEFEAALETARRAGLRLAD